MSSTEAVLGDLRVGLVHDWLRVFGGAERVVAEMHSLFPEAPIYTLLHDPEKLEGLFEDAQVVPSFLQKLPRAIRGRHKALLPVLPTAFENFSFKDFDVVLSSSSSFAKGVITPPESVHISYCHTPMRFAWDWNRQYLEEQSIGGLRKAVAIQLMTFMRLWDFAAADRVDYFLANSQTTARRIRAYYGRESRVVYPPVDVDRFRWDQESEGFFLVVSRLSPYKRIDMVVQACNKMRVPLVVVGAGSDFARLQAMAGPTVKVLGFLSDEDIVSYYERCEAFIFSAEDDFGITAVEAMAAGRPVLALRRGGATETVVEGETGLFYDDPYEELIADGIREMRERLAGDGFDRSRIRARAEEFSRERFVESYRDAVVESVAEYRSENGLK